MRTIWKAELEAADLQTVAVPADAELLTVANQNEKLCLWFICDTEKPHVLKQIAIVGTGNPFTIPPATYQYLGSAQFQDGALVWHVFERW